MKNFNQAREEQILIWLCEGKNNKELAGLACISESTVANLLTLIFAEHGVKNRTQLVCKLLREGF